MIRINLAPVRGRRRDGRRVQACQLAGVQSRLLFGVVYLGLLLGLGVYWWVLMSTQASLTADVDRRKSDLALAQGADRPGEQGQGPRQRAA